MHLKIVSWNIWISKHVPEVITQLKELNPDIIGLQEVIEIAGNNAADQIANKLGYHYMFCKAFTSDRHTPVRTIGNAILSKMPLEKISCVLLSDLDHYNGTHTTEPRSVGLATLSNTDLTIGTTHLGYTKDMVASDSQKIQAKTLLQAIPDKKFILMGDFNSLPDSEIVTTIEKKLININNDGSIPTRLNEHDAPYDKVRIDYFFVSHDIQYSNFIVYPTQASDHTPISVEIEI